MKRLSFRKAYSFYAAILGVSMLLSNGALAGNVDSMQFEGVAEFSTNFWYTEFEKPYFEKTLPQISNGKLRGNALPFDQLGMTGFEMMRLLRKGTYDFAAGSLGYVTGDSPEIEGVMLAGTIHNVDELMRASSNYFPILAKDFERRYNSKLIALYPYPNSWLFCNLGNKNVTKVGLNDLKGKTIRSYATTVSDYIEGLGAKAVTISFGEIATAMQRGTIDCAVSTTMTGYNTKFQQVATHLIQASDYSAGYFAFNLDTWNKLTPDAQKLINTSLNDLAKQMAERTKKDEQDATACLTSGPCPYGEPGNMTFIKLSPQDLALEAQVVKNTVVPRWTSRCTSPSECLKDWNAAVGSVVGMTVAK